MKKPRQKPVGVSIPRSLPPVATAGQPLGAGRAGPYVVGIGASAGGLEACEQFLSQLPPDNGMTFVLVQHLDPTHKGMMPELLGRHTKMQVVQAQDGVQVKPNCLYVIPPDAELAILKGQLQVLAPTSPRGLRTPIDFFFRHLAEDQKEKAVGIILSGMGSDGALGIRAIKEQLGMVMVQDPALAKYDGMPRSAIATGVVDYIAAAAELPGKLLQYARHRPALAQKLATGLGEPSSALEKVFVLLRAHGGNDFSCYKKSTIVRRMERRMGIHQFDSVARYARFLQENPQEVELLAKELLIGVTSFFREPDMYHYLKREALTRLLGNRPPGRPLRVWNPACSTGEETYSLAITLTEVLEGVSLQERPRIQIFATDIDREAIDQARRGKYPAGIAADVSPERLRRFFDQEEESYRIKKEIRDLVVFAPQNILVDPPFTKVDLLCCRNLLIYLNIEAQKKLLPLMHYALNPGGLMVLGSSESAGGREDLFASLDKKWKVFQRVEVPTRPPVEMPASLPPREQCTMVVEKSKELNMDIVYVAQRALLDLYGPPAVVVNPEGDILYVSGRTGKYLEPASGKVNSNVFAMVREGLREELALAIHNASTRNTVFTAKGVHVKSNGGFTTINLTVRPLADPAAPRSLLMVVFEERTEEQAHVTAAKGPVPLDPAVPPNELEAELRRTREQLRCTVEEMQTAQEELRSTNEELQSNNEELQSTNEELNSSKEELQSLNEEMQTVNAELQAKMAEVSQSNSDMKNLLDGIKIATIFLDKKLAIKRFTPEAGEIVRLMVGDVGRPLSDFAVNLKYDRLMEDAKAVLESLAPRNVQVESRDGHWYHMRILPYRTSDEEIDGVVMTFNDITAMKNLEEALRASGERVVADLKAMTLLQEIGTRCTRGGNAFTECLYGILDVAIAITGAEKGNIQMLDADSKALVIAAHRGFEEPFLKFFATVGLEAASACGQALRSAGRVIVEDVANSEVFAEKPSLKVLLGAGVRAVQSTPLVSSAGQVLGMISTHSSRPHAFGQGESPALSLLARQAGDYLERKRGEKLAQVARDYAENIIATIREPLVVLDGELRIVSASQSFYQTFGVTPAETEHRMLYDIGEQQWQIPALRKLLDEILPTGKQFRDFRVEHDFPGIGHRVLILNAREMAGGDHQPRLILLAMEDVTPRPETAK